MYRDYPVEGKSNENCHKCAKDSRKSFAIINENRVDLIASLHQDRIQTCYGIKRLRFGVKANIDLDGDEGMTVFSPGYVTIVLSTDVHDALRYGEVRSRSTVAHELGHAVMHEGPPMHRGPKQANHYRWIPPFKSAEHQAKVFAPAFLIDDDLALKISNSEEMAVTFGVSLETADIYLRGLRRPEEKRRVAEKLRLFSRELNSAEPQGPRILA